MVDMQGAALFYNSSDTLFETASRECLIGIYKRLFNGHNV